MVHELNHFALHTKLYVKARQQAFGKLARLKAAQHQLTQSECLDGRSEMDRRYEHQCAAASGVRDEGRSLAIGLQEQVANHRKRRAAKARVVSVTEKAS
jgi:hypothetical protein